MKRIALLLGYDGSDFHGFAPQTDQVTVANTLSDSIGKVFNQPIELTCAGRTDAGVHASYQVVHFDYDESILKRPFEKTRFLKSMSTMLPPAIFVRNATEVDDSFSARFSATSRTYNYIFTTGENKDPIVSRYSYHIFDKVDFNRMDEASKALVGEHDFAAFCKSNKELKSTIRRVNSVQMKKNYFGMDVFEINASAFCHQMVRSITGLLIEIGIGKRTVTELDRILKGKSRNELTFIAPPHGLHLVHVSYPIDVFTQS